MVKDKLLGNMDIKDMKFKQALSWLEEDHQENNLGDDRAKIVGGVITRLNEIRNELERVLFH